MRWSTPQKVRIDQLGVERSVDLHCHCLPGIDDGPATMAESLELCQALVEDGVTSVVATPHQLGMFGDQNAADGIRQHIERLKKELDRRSIPLELISGGDVRIDPELESLLDEGIVDTVGGLGKHLLLELPHELFVEPAAAIDALSARGVQTIMTHPERHRYLDARLDRVAAWVGQGAVLQVTAGSLVGDFGQRAMAMGWRLIEMGLVAIIAGDVHDAWERPPRMTAALDAVAAHAGPKLARRIFGENPLKVWHGELIEPAR